MWRIEREPESYRVHWEPFPARLVSEHIRAERVA